MGRVELPRRRNVPVEGMRHSCRRAYAHEIDRRKAMPVIADEDAGTVSKPHEARYVRAKGRCEARGVRRRNMAEVEVLVDTRAKLTWRTLAMRYTEWKLFCMRMKQGAWSLKPDKSFDSRIR